MHLSKQTRRTDNDENARNGVRFWLAFEYMGTKNIAAVATTQAKYLPGTWYLFSTIYMYRYVGHVFSAIEKSDLDQVLSRKRPISR